MASNITQANSRTPQKSVSFQFGSTPKPSSTGLKQRKKTPYKTKNDSDSEAANAFLPSFAATGGGLFSSTNANVGASTMFGSPCPKKNATLNSDADGDQGFPFNGSIPSSKKKSFKAHRPPKVETVEEENGTETTSTIHPKDFGFKKQASGNVQKVTASKPTVAKATTSIPFNSTAKPTTSSFTIKSITTEATANPDAVNPMDTPATDQSKGDINGTMAATKVGDTDNVDTALKEKRAVASGAFSNNDTEGSHATDPCALQAEAEASLIDWKLLPHNYKDCPVEEILNMFRDELEVDTINYVSEVKNLHKSENIIRDSTQTLIQLAQTVQTVMVNQEDVFASFVTIETFQKQMEWELATLENQVDQIYQAAKDFPPNQHDDAREASWIVTQQIETAMDDMESLSVAILNENVTVPFNLDGLDETSDVGQLVVRLQSFAKTLSELELKSVHLKQGLGELERVFPPVK